MWGSEIESSSAEEVIKREIVPAVDYLINCFRTDDSTWRSLYLGHLLEQLHRPGVESESEFDVRHSVLNQQREGLMKLLSPLFDSNCLEIFDRRLCEMHDAVTRKVQDGVSVRVLFVGDCLWENIVGFLNVPLLEHGVTLRYEYVATRNPVERRSALRALSAGKFDLICYSPYSNEFNPTLLETLLNPNPLQSRSKLRRMSANAHDQTRSTLALLTELFDCTIFIQNTNNIRRNNGRPYSIAMNLLTRRPRTIVACEVNSLLDQTLSEMNQELSRPLVKVDELNLKKEHGELALGKLYYSSDKYHPSVMAHKLSLCYRNLILATTFLSTKKVVVIDLDDTVWKGTIAEGAVEHYMDRQQILKDLRRKGVLLAIASRNDPQNVHWTGGVLQPTDFVAAEINWETKHSSVRRIASQLNLNLKDFVFIDDRADQRALVKSAIPEIQVLDATVDSSWDMLRWWAASLPEQTETDRTRLYHERLQREQFLKVDKQEHEESALFATLNLKVHFHVATRKELPRVAELINRTNQFNTCGSRASIKQITNWAESNDHLILVAESSDRFGGMGIVSAMVLAVTAEALIVQAWVLSCRVFGYGIDAAMLNYLRKLGQRLHVDVVRGQIVETPANQPCRGVYASNGFIWQDSAWTSKTTAILPGPDWLEISMAEDNNAIARICKLQ